MRQIRVCAALLLLCSGMTACAVRSGPDTARDVRLADDVPTQFVTEDGTPAVQGCRDIMIDPRDQTRLRLMRTDVIGGAHRGDYDVPAGKYGVSERELLRIDCATGETIGIVRN